jgi:hypothetical protein
MPYYPLYPPLSSFSPVGGHQRRKKKGSRSSGPRSTGKKTRRRSAKSKSRSSSRKPKRVRLVKGSAAAKAWGRKMRALRRRG